MKDEQTVPEVSREQVRAANDYLEAYMKGSGMRFPSELPESEDEIPPFWNDEARRQLKIYYGYGKQQDEKGIII